MRFLPLAAFLALVPAAAAQTRAPKPAGAPPAPTPVTLASAGADLPVDRIAAVVGAKVIMFSEVLEAVFERRAQGTLQVPEDSAGQAAVARQVLGELVDEEVLVQKATDAKTEVSDDEVNTTVDGQFKQIRARFQTESQFRSELQRAGRGSPDDLRRELREQTRRQLMVQRYIQKLREENKLAGGTVTDEEIRREFETRRATAQKRPATVGFRQIVVSPAASKAARDRALAKADSLLVELRKGGNFDLIAKRESMDPGSKELGGDLGWHRRGEMVTEFNDAMFSLNPGQLSRPVETAFGFHIIRVDRVQPAEVKVRHILITPAIDSADVLAARARADTAFNKWKAGVDFNTLAAAYHDRRAGEQAVIPEVAQDSLPPSYAGAIVGRKQGDILPPFAIPGSPGRPTKFAVAQITLLSAGGEFTLAEVRNRIRESLAQQKGMQRMLAGLRESVYVSMRL